MIQFFPNTIKSRPLILDDYPEVITAYSLRKLRSAYTGSAIRVRRSSDNALLDIGFLPNGDFDSQAALNFVGSGNGFVNTWYDQSGNSYNFTEGSSPYLIIQNGNLGTQNNRPSVFSLQTNLVAKEGFLNIAFSVNVNSTNGFNVIDVSNQINTINTTQRRTMFSYGNTNDFSVNNGVILFSNTSKFINGTSTSTTVIPRDSLIVKEYIGEQTNVYLRLNNGAKTDQFTITYNRTGLLLNIMGEMTTGFVGRSNFSGYSFEKIFFADFNEARRQVIVNNQLEYYGIL